MRGDNEGREGKGGEGEQLDGVVLANSGLVGRGGLGGVIQNGRAAEEADQLWDGWEG